MIPPKYNPESSNRFIAYFDILGFKDMMFKEGHESVLQKVKTVKDSLTMIVDGTGKGMEMTTKLKSFYFSDSFFIFSEGDSIGDLYNLFFRCCAVMGFCLQQKIPLKGAISYGKITADFENSIFVGQPIIDAYLLHNELHMFGVVIDHNVERRMKEIDSEKKDKVEEEYWGYTHGYLIKYKTPTKKGKIYHQCLRWAVIVAPPATEFYMTHDKLMVEKFYLSVSGEPRIYIDNTIEFLDFLFDDARRTYTGIKELTLPKKDEPAKLN